MEITEYRPGTPCWVDLGVPDPSTTSEFYAELFGWTVHDTGDEGGGSRMCLRHGKPVAGIGPHSGGSSGPRSWTTYICVRDADAAAEAVRRAAGQVQLEPMDVLDAGRMAVFTDPSGAAIAAWQPNEHIGSAVLDEPGAPCWHELATRDPESAVEFYSAVFGWEAANEQIGAEDYTAWRLEGRTIAGMIQMTASWPTELPAHWTVYFTVADTDAAIEHLDRLGGTVLAGPTDIEPGRFAVVHDPAGGLFGIIAINPAAAPG
ncbi:MAG: VOC family protein [Saccharopolyspora sp.]|uniref:VOC family protein n=1 Tax=Saccharopolyspora sp. TaxID=33915 RepID=UPI0025FF315D|nr:VOC family protein [Saccharopolyspora sp.]MBQ6641875.1 VOC family protein [Saccharopolyspora sp.]